MTQQEKHGSWDWGFNSCNEGIAPVSHDEKGPELAKLSNYWSPQVMKLGPRQKERDPGHKHLQTSFSAGCPSHSLLLLIKRSQLWWFRHLNNKPPGGGGVLGHVPLGGDPEADPELVEELVPLWFGNILGSLRGSWRFCLGQGGEVSPLNLFPVWPDLGMTWDPRYLTLCGSAQPSPLDSQSLIIGFKSAWKMFINTRNKNWKYNHWLHLLLIYMSKRLLVL